MGEWISTLGCIVQQKTARQQKGTGCGYTLWPGRVSSVSQGVKEASLKGCIACDPIHMTEERGRLRGWVLAGRCTRRQ